jgi:hypothetical protein
VQAHARPDLAEFPHRWRIWPGGEQLDWAEARMLLARCPRPVLVAPLLESGMLGLWASASLDEQQRETVRRGLADQVRYYAGKLAAVGVERGPVRFGSGASCFEMTGDEFLRWANEYGINVGISLEPSEDAGVARVRVHPTMGSPPLTL